MNAVPNPGAQPAYVCGHAPREFDRLALQSRIYEAVTRRLLVRAGVDAGQHVVDLGCGGGDVSRLAADAVGPGGLVIGVDRSRDAVATARARAADRPQARFVVGELDTWQPEAAVDAVIGRFVLMHQRDPAALLARARGWVRPGGVVAFVESDTGGLRPGVHSRPHSPTYQRIVDVWHATITAAGAHLGMGPALAAAFVAAGFADPSVEVDTYTSGDQTSPIFRFAVESLRSMLPMAAAAGIPAPSRDELEGLEAALRREVAASGGMLSAPPAYAVWARVEPE
ncbi:MAG: trans-aconitate 2-methyltransferase [Vicinamibacterales bacterium]